MNRKIVAWVRRVAKRATPYATRMARSVGVLSRRFRLADTLLARSTAPLVSAYRTLLSPHKGFRCAHAAVTGGPSCSDVALNAFTSNTFASAVEIVDEQLARCQHAYVVSYSNLVDEAIRNLPNLAGSADYVIQTGGISCCGDDPGPPPP